MAPRKLSDADRQDILNRYRQPEETTVTIADHYGVSTSTISRILKQNLSEAEYDSLIQQKRSGIYKSTTEQAELPVAVVEKKPMEPEIREIIKPTKKPVKELIKEAVRDLPIKEPIRDFPAKPGTPLPPRRRQRKRPGLPETADFSEDQASQLELPSSFETDNEFESAELGQETESSSFAPAFVPVGTTELKEIEAELERLRQQKSQELDEEDELEEDELDEDELDEDDLDDEDFDDDLDLTEEPVGFSPVHIQAGGSVRVLPLTEAEIPKICYVVVDRSAELITRPLKDFADLGQIPDEETLERTLPIFDNHRIAKRFTRRMQRVVKVPDGRVLQKVTPYLQAKGITRLLIDGQVYSLS